MLVIQNVFKHGSLFINDNGTIKEVTFVSMQIIKKEDTHIVIWKFKHNDIEGEINTEYGQCPFSISADKAVENCTDILEDYKVYVSGTRIPILHDDVLNKFYFNVFTFRNGVVKCENLELSSILYEKRFNSAYVELVEDVKYYQTKDECIAFNKITEIDYNGNENIYPASGYMQDMVAYTDEQKKVIKTLQKAFKDAKECGLQYILGDCDMHLINVKSFPKHKVSDGDWDCYENALDIYFTEDVAKVEGVYRNCGDSPVLVVD